MAVKFEGARKRWLGLSSDEKPAIDRTLQEHAEGQIPVGSTFLETDTGYIYVWGGVAWKVRGDDMSSADHAATDHRLIAEVASIRRMLAVKLDLPDFANDEPPSKA